jgi:preprotein translocase subunit YajC
MPWQRRRPPRKVTSVLYAAEAQGGGSYTPLLLIVLLFGVMYFMMIRPQQKRRKEAAAMQSALSAGDEIVTIGGLHATVVEVEDDVVTVEISPGVNVRFARPAIAKVLRQTGTPLADGVVADDVIATPVDAPYESPVVETKKAKD